MSSIKVHIPGTCLEPAALPWQRPQASGRNDCIWGRGPVTARGYRQPHFSALPAVLCLLCLINTWKENWWGSGLSFSLLLSKREAFNQGQNTAPPYVDVTMSLDRSDLSPLSWPRGTTEDGGIEGWTSLRTVICTVFHWNKRHFTARRIGSLRTQTVSPYSKEYQTDPVPLGSIFHNSWKYKNTVST